VGVGETDGLALVDVVGVDETDGRALGDGVGVADGRALAVGAAKDGGAVRETAALVVALGVAAADAGTSMGSFSQAQPASSSTAGSSRAYVNSLFIY
jgi:hypothetical protein